MQEKIEQILKANNCMGFEDVTNNLILVSNFGSRLNDCATCGSDIDLYCVYVPPIEQVMPIGFIVGYDKVPIIKNYHLPNLEYEGLTYDIRFTSLPSFFEQAEHGSPIAQEILFTEDSDYQYNTIFWKSVRSIRNKFVSVRPIAKFIGMSRSHVYDYEKNGKNKALAEGMRAAIDGYEYSLGKYRQTKRRELYLNIKSGNFKLEEIKEAQTRYIRGMEEVYMKNTLPEKPDSNMIRLVLRDVLRNYYYSKG